MKKDFQKIRKLFNFKLKLVLISADADNPTFQEPEGMKKIFINRVEVLISLMFDNIYSYFN